MNLDRYALADRIITYDDGKQAEYWFSPSRDKHARLTRETPLAGKSWRLEKRQSPITEVQWYEDGALARAEAAEWTARDSSTS